MVNTVYRKSMTGVKRSGAGIAARLLNVQTGKYINSIAGTKRERDNAVQLFREVSAIADEYISILDIRKTPRKNL
jgi:hypothetical protein